MTQTGTWNLNFGAQECGLVEHGDIHWNYAVDALYQMALARSEGIATDKGALAVTTGQHTGRSATDKFIVRDQVTEKTIWWQNNKSITTEQFYLLHQDFLDYAQDRDLFVQDLYAGADPQYRLRVRVITEFSWHALFIRHLLRRPELAELNSFVPELTIIDLPGFKADPARHGCQSETVIAANLAKGIVLIGNTEYAGEIKKSVFGVLNYLLPDKGVLPMHCSANVGDNQDAALFFGLSGTGKTTLSSDASRTLIGDDEHGWSDNGIFNFEGGCYAKTIRLSAKAEPEIYAATQMRGAVLENVVIDPDTGVPDFDDSQLTENARVAYPMDFIANASKSGMSVNPKNIIMLTADASGILPPIARLTPDQAMYYFLSGYTAKVAGTEKDVTGTVATFSTCFGAPFMPRYPTVYGKLLKNKIAEHGATCWLVNTGWTGGCYGTGSRMPIQATRALLKSALDGSLNNTKMRIDENFGFEVPLSVAGVDSSLLDPRKTWSDRLAYDREAALLVGKFIENFAKFENHVGGSIRQAAPQIPSAA